MAELQFPNKYTQMYTSLTTFPADVIYGQPKTQHHLTVPHYRLSTFGRRAFSVAGPTVWNSLPDSP